MGRGRELPPPARRRTVVLLASSTKTKPACPICGAENFSCGATPTVVDRDTDWEVRSDGTVVVDRRYAHRLAESRWLSTREELVRVADGKYERHYAAGDPVPLLVALSQGQVSRKQLTEVDKTELKRHVREGVVTIEQLRDALVAGG